MFLLFYCLYSSSSSPKPLKQKKKKKKKSRKKKPYTDKLGLCGGSLGLRHVPQQTRVKPRTESRVRNIQTSFKSGPPVIRDEEKWKKKKKKKK